MKLATAAEMKELDRQAIEEWGIPSIDLMERAAEGICGAVLEELGHPRSACRAAVVCGAGNNGGDGIAAARLLAKAGVQVRAFLVGREEKLTPDSRVMRWRLEQKGLALEPWQDTPEQRRWLRGCDYIIDALFGVGLSREIAPDSVYAAVIGLINTSPARVVAADVPSGVSADSGYVFGCAVKADKTITFTLPKVGHLVGEGGQLTGELRVGDIGIPEELVNKTPCRAWTVEEDYVRAALPRRDPMGHKGTFGTAALVCGSVGYTGAPVLAARAAMAGGCGLVSLGVPDSIYPIVASRCLEPMPYPLAEQEGAVSINALQTLQDNISRADAVLIGPGLSRRGDAPEVVRTLLESLAVPVVLDADGINALEGHTDVLERRRGRVTILTPHDGEFARLDSSLAGGDRPGAARAFAQRYGCYLVLKGHVTVTASPAGTVLVNTTGNDGMAKGGSGDVLAGLMTSFLAQGMSPMAAAASAVWLHGRAGDLAAELLTPYAMTPGDMIDCFGPAFQSVLI